MRPQRGGLPRVAMLQQADEHDGVVGQILADPGQICAHLDPVFAQVAGGPDAGAHQESGRMHAARGQDDLARVEPLHLSAADLCGHAADAAPFEQQCRDGGTIDDGQISARSHRSIEIADRRRRALVRPVAHRHRAIAIAEIRIHVGNERNLPLLRERMYRFRQRRPVVRPGAADRHRTAAAMHVAAEIQVVLELAVIGQHVVPAPAGRSVRLPFGVVVGRTAIRHHAHHRGAAAHDAPLGKTDQRRIILAAPMHLEAGPEIGVVVIGRGVGIEHVGGLVTRRRIGPGLEQQHAPGRSCGESIGQHASGRAAADDDDVEAVGHVSSAPFDFQFLVH